MTDLTINDIQGLVIATTELVRSVGKKFIRANNQDAKKVVDLQVGGREIKLAADKILEKQLIKGLNSFGFPILSEETGFIDSGKFKNLLWVIDPLDGSYNFSRGLGPSMISVALWQGNEPVLGVLFNLVTKQLSFGGPKIGAYVEKVLVHVSDREERGQATLWLVATGAADVYAEHNIMFWDVAAGLAIVNGAGGTFEIEGVNLPERVFSEPCTVVASNGKFDASVSMFDAVRGL